MTAIDDTYQRLSARYAAGTVPWDQPEPPPEVMALAAELAPGRALDVGCGYGRSAIYLATRGWEVDAVDFVDQAVAEARRRALAAGVAHRVHVHRATVPQLDFLPGGYDLVLDVGCGHGLGVDDLPAYRDALARLMPPGALLAWFSRVRSPEDAEPPASGPRGLPEAEVRQVFEAAFTLERVTHGQSGGSDGPTWPSAWHWFRRTT